MYGLHALKVITYVSAVACAEWQNILRLQEAVHGKGCKARAITNNPALALGAAVIVH